ncbi:hypothetical protein MW887_006675 [Aspergillus wentii]|nr:hypothetical protein MW887_006675 [Aspergillus wentii]
MNRARKRQKISHPRSLSHSHSYPSQRPYPTPAVVIATPSRGLHSEAVDWRRGSIELGDSPVFRLAPVPARAPASEPRSGSEVGEDGAEDVENAENVEDADDAGDVGDADDDDVENGEDVEDVYNAVSQETAGDVEDAEDAEDLQYDENAEGAEDVDEVEGSEEEEEGEDDEEADNTDSQETAEEAANSQAISELMNVAGSVGDVDVNGQDHDQDEPEESELTNQTFDTAVVSQRTPSPTRDGRMSHLKKLQTEVDRGTGNVQEEEARAKTPQADSEEVLLPSTGDRVGLAQPVHLPKELADHLVAIYITRQHVDLPILNLTEFKSAYEAARADDSLTTGSTAFHGILCIIFALSSLTIDTISDQKRQSLFNRGQKLTNVFGSRGTQWVMMQSYILQSQYVNATGNPRLAWAFIGYTISMAQSLGLFSKTIGHGVRERRDRELARKIWHSAVIMERILALQLGILPRTSNAFQIPLPSHLDEDYVDAISGELSKTKDDRPSVVEFMTASARLYNHVEEIMGLEEEFRLRANGCSAKKLLAFDMQPFLKVDGLLYDWKVSLPSFLRVDGTGEDPDDPIVLRQRNVLRIRYLYIRLRLYRPFLILGLALSTQCNCRSKTPHLTGEDFTSPDSPIALGLVRDASIKCVVAAIELVNLLNRYEFGLSNEDRPSPVAEYWENVDYLYACGTVLIAARSCPFLSGDKPNSISRKRLDWVWTKIKHLLKHYEKKRRNSRLRNVAQSCLRILVILSETESLSQLLDEQMGNRLFQRSEPDTPRRSSHARKRVSDASCFILDDDVILTSQLPQPGIQTKGTFFGWIESLPVDLSDEL